jgi:hypothetical protein
MRPIVRSYLIEIPTGTTSPGPGSTIYINDYPQLRNVWLCGIMFHDNNVLAIGPSGKTVYNNLTNVLFTAVDIYGQEMVKQHPAKDLAPYYSSGFYRDFKPFQFNLVKSYITNVASITADRVICASILYYTGRDVPTTR